MSRTDSNNTSELASVCASIIIEELQTILLNDVIPEIDVSIVGMKCWSSGFIPREAIPAAILASQRAVLSKGAFNKSEVFGSLRNAIEGAISNAPAPVPISEVVNELRCVTLATERLVKTTETMQDIIQENNKNILETNQQLRAMYMSTNHMIQSVVMSADKDRAENHRHLLELIASLTQNK